MILCFITGIAVAFLIFFVAIHEKKEVEDAEYIPNLYDMVDEAVRKEYGSSASWSLDFADKQAFLTMEDGRYPICVSDNGILAFRDVYLADPTKKKEPDHEQAAHLEESPEDVMAEKKPVEQPSEDSKEDPASKETGEKEVFDALAWCNEQKMHDALASLKKPGVFLIPADFLPERKYWEEIVEKKYLIGFTSAVISDEDNGIKVSLD